MEWFLYRNVAEAGEDGCGIVDKLSGSVGEMGEVRWRIYVAL